MLLISNVTFLHLILAIMLGNFCNVDFETLQIRHLQSWRTKGLPRVFVKDFCCIFQGLAHYFHFFLTQRHIKKSPPPPKWTTKWAFPVLCPHCFIAEHSHDQVKMVRQVKILTGRNSGLNDLFCIWIPFCFLLGELFPGGGQVQGPRGTPTMAIGSVGGPMGSANRLPSGSPDFPAPPPQLHLSLV